MWKQESEPSHRYGIPSFAGMAKIPVAWLVVFLTSLTPALLPLNWLFGTTLIWVLLVAGLNLFCWRKPSSIEWVLTGVAVLLILGLVSGQISGLPADKVASSIYHLVHWFILIAFINIGRSFFGHQHNEEIFMRLMRAAFIGFSVMIVYMFLVALYVSSTPLEPIQFPSLIIGRFGEQLDIFSGYSKIFISKINVTSAGQEWRLIGFGLWTSEGAYLAAILGLFSTLYVYSKYGFKALIVVELCVIIAIVLTGSRNSIASYLLASAVWLTLIGRHWKTLIILASPILLAAAVTFFLYGIDYIANLFNEANEYREASSNTRFTSYKQAWEMTMDYNPITGLGYTPEIPSILGVPIGSHSSWTSILIRGGLAAVSMFLVFHAVLLNKIASAATKLFVRAGDSRLSEILPLLTLTRCVIITILWWITEDLDGPAFGAAFAGLVIGLFLGLLNLECRNGEAFTRFRNGIAQR